jgi:hypothetical protein
MFANNTRKRIRTEYRMVVYLVDARAWFAKIYAFLICLQY